MDTHRTIGMTFLDKAVSLFRQTNPDPGISTSPIARYIGCEPGKFASNSRQRQRYALRCKAMSQLAEKFAGVSESNGTMQWPGEFTRRARRSMARLIAKRAYQQGVE